MLLITDGVSFEHDAAAIVNYIQLSSGEANIEMAKKKI